MLILGAATLAIVGVLFAIYNSLSGTPSVVKDGESPPPPEIDEPLSPPSENAGVEVSEGVALGGGQHASFKVYDENDDRPRAEIEYDSWTPVAGSEDQFNVTKPRISMRTPNGQLIEVEANSGLLQARKGNGDRLDLRYGTLMGDVQILVDRLDDQQRAALPEEEQRRPTPDRLVVICMEDVTFDREYNRLTTAGAFSIKSAEAEISGIGLSLRYNEVDSAVEDLKTDRGGRIVVRGLGRLVKVGVFGDEEPVKQEVNATETEPPPPSTPRARPSHPTFDEDGVLVLDLGPDEEEQEQPEPARTVRYRARFGGDVNVQEVQDGEVTGEMVADLLEVFFSFGNVQRQAARDRSAVVADQDTGDEAEGVKEPAASELTLVWSGPLALDTIEPASATDEAAGEKLRVVATGKAVHVHQPGRGNVTCSRLVYDENIGRLRLTGGEAPAVVETADGGMLEGPDVLLDLETRTARVAGPGRMRDQRAPALAAGSGLEQDTSRKPVDIRFQQELQAAFDSAQTRESPDQPPTRKLYLKTAVLIGAVHMAQGADLLTARRVELGFAPPRAQHAFADNLRRLLAEGEVVLAHGAESVRCERLEVDTGLDESGQIAPRRAYAYGSVSARRGERSITAGERMIVDLRSYPVVRQPWDLSQAKAEAARRGIDPDTVDWEEQQTRYESRDEFRPGIHALEAYGGVEVRDPAQNLRVTADELNCGFQDGRTINRALIVGNEISPAHVVLQDYAVTGREVHLDMSTQSLEVPGRGRLAFRSRRDLDGRELKRPTQTVVTWSDHFAHRGTRDRAIITGNVHAATEQSTFDCAELTIHFAERAPESKPPAAQAAGSPDAWFIGPFKTRFSDLWDNRDSDFEIEDDFNKEPVQLLATGGAVALTTKTEPGTGRVISRGRIAGPKIFVDLENETMTVEGAGNLLIEDYELPAAVTRTASRTSDGTRTPFGGLGAESPSQTLVGWDGDMVFYFGRQAVVFDRKVEMSYRSGTEIVLGSQVVGESTYSAAVESAGEQGRRSWLSCDRLAVEFDQSAADRRGGAGAGDVSGYELQRFEAGGQVHFEDSGVVVLARQVTYDADRTVLVIRGGLNDPATIYDQREKFQELTAEFIEWNRQTGRIWAPEARIIGR